MSQITTHILDTSRGAPASGVEVVLLEKSDHGWQEIGAGFTNEDGRVSDLLKSEILLPPAQYQLIFKTGLYYQNLNIKSFYPEVSILFETFDQSHYHVPLLLNPFGYSTYRGS